MLDFAPITYEAWEAFAAERLCWEIVDVTGAYVATDRKRYTHGTEFNNPMDATFVAQTFPTREEAAFYIGLCSMQAALTKTGIIHADA